MMIWVFIIIYAPICQDIRRENMTIQEIIEKLKKQREDAIDKMMQWENCKDEEEMVSYYNGISKGLKKAIELLEKFYD